MENVTVLQWMTGVARWLTCTPLTLERVLPFLQGQKVAYCVQQVRCCWTIALNIRGLGLYLRGEYIQLHL